MGCESPWWQPSRSQVIENCPVTGIRVRTDDFGVRRVAAVETEHGAVQTPCVVNCAGGRIPAAERPRGCPRTLALLRGEASLGAPRSGRQGASRADRPPLPAGVWADAVGRMAGVKVPLVAMHHAYVVTERIEGIQVGGRRRGSLGGWLVGGVEAWVRASALTRGVTRVCGQALRGGVSGGGRGPVGRLGARQGLQAVQTRARGAGWGQRGETALV